MFLYIEVKIYFKNRRNILKQKFIDLDKECPDSK